jgi:hypothetical protein
VERLKMWRALIHSKTVQRSILYDLNVHKLMTPYIACTFLYLLIPTLSFASTLKENLELRFSDAYSIR